MVDDGQRHKHRTRPVAHVPEVDVKPFADEQHLARDGRDVVPAHEAKQREVELGEGVHPRDTAEVAGHLAGLEHTRVRDGEAGELEREVSLHGGVHLGGTVGVDVPAAVSELAVEDVVHRLALPFRVHRVRPVVIRHHVGHERHVHDEFAQPVTFPVLDAEEILLRPLRGRRERGLGELPEGMSGLGGR